MIPAHETKEGERYGVVRVSISLLAKILADGSEIRARVSHGLPPGAAIVDCRRSDIDGAIDLLISGVAPGVHDIWHESIPEDFK